MVGWTRPLKSIYPSDFPYRAHFIQVGGYRLAYLDEGVADQTILMVHGNPVSGYVYARLMQYFLPRYRCVVPDLLGFGLSEKPVDEADYSLTKHIDLMEQFVAALNLENVIIIGHDWGGPIGFGAAVRQKERYSHLVILNTLTEAPMKIMPIYKLPFHFFLRARRPFSYLVRQRNLFQKMGVAVMAEADQQVYFRANHSPETRAAIAAFPRMIPYKEAHPNCGLLRGILNELVQWDIPALVLFSDHDSVFSAAQGKRFAARLKQARFKEIKGPKHFLQYQAAERVAAEMADFLEMKDGNGTKNRTVSSG